MSAYRSQNIYRGMEMASPDRLLLRPLIYEDVKDLYIMESDPEVMKYDYEDIKTLEMSKLSIVRNIFYNRITPDFCKWVALEKSSGNFIGWICLRKINQFNRCEIGFRLKKEYWGLGFATELVKKILEHTFSIKEIIEIIARSHPENYAAHRVLEKNGFIKTIDKNPFRDGNYFFSILKEYYYLVGKN